VRRDSIANDRASKSAGETSGRRTCGWFNPRNDGPLMAGACSEADA